MADREKPWILDMLAEPVITPWRSEGHCGQNGSELQIAIIKGFSEDGINPVWTRDHKEFTFKKIFTFKEHGEFFRGAQTMASLRYSGDFYELLKRYGSIKVTIVKKQKEPANG